MQNLDVKSSTLPQLQSIHLKDEAYRLIKQAITSLRFRPGDTVIEGDLARLLGISKTPVRNALVRLEQEGLVQTVPFRGTFVSSVSVSDVRDLYEVRGALEEMAIRHLLSDAGDEELEALRAAISEAGSALENGHLEESFNSIRDFHEGLIASSGNHWLVEMYGNLSDHLARIRNICGHMPGRVEKSTDEHTRILEAIQQHDEREAIQALRDHLESLIVDYSHAAAESIAALPAGLNESARAGTATG